MTLNIHLVPCSLIKLSSSFLQAVPLINFTLVCAPGDYLHAYIYNMAVDRSTSLPVMGEIAGVNMTSLGGYLHISKTRAR